MQSIAAQLAAELHQSPAHVEAVIALMDEGNTIPFIARYRKEQHGAMDDTTLRTLAERLQALRNLQARREEVCRAIDKQGKLTEALAEAIANAATLSEVEDLYRPYQQKRRTRASIAREKGLEPLADALFAQGRNDPAPETLAQDYVNEELGVATPADALKGAADILAERISDDADIRRQLRPLLRRESRLHTRAAAEGDSVYRLYYDFSQPLNRLAGHQILAINRGEREGALKIALDQPEEQARILIRRRVLQPGAPGQRLRPGGL